MARGDGVPPDCLQLCKEIEEVPGLVDDESRVEDTSDRIA